MKKILFAYFFLASVIQICTAQLSNDETVRLLQSTFFRECGTMQYPKVERKGEKLFFNPVFGIQLQRSFPSFGYMTTTVTADELSYLPEEQEILLDINIQQFAGKKKLEQWSSNAVRRDGEIFIAAGGLAFRSCTDSLFVNGIKTVEDFEAMTRLKSRDPGRLLLTKDDESEIRFSKYDEGDELWYDVYFPNRNPNNLKKEHYKTVYSKPTPPDTTRIREEDVMNLVKNSVLQNIIITRIIQDTLLLAQLHAASKLECPTTDELPLSIVPAYDEVLLGLEVIPYAVGSNYGLRNRTASLFSPTGMKLEIYPKWYALMNGYQLYYVVRLKDSNLVRTGPKSEVQRLARELGKTEPARLKQEWKNWPDSIPLPPAPPVPLPDFIPGRYNYFDLNYEFYLVGYDVKKEEILFLSGSDICLHQDIHMYAPREKPYLSFVKWPKSNQIEFIHDKLLPMRPEGLVLDDVSRNSDVIKGTVWVIDKGMRVEKTFIIDVNSPYKINFD